MTTPDLRFPIGRFERRGHFSQTDRSAHIDRIMRLPTAARAAVAGLTQAQLDTPYRPDGWTVRQVVHHLPDSHVNAYVRLKLALTEDGPTIRPYNEQLWAELEDSRSTPIEVSLAMLEAVHERMVRLLKAMPADAFAREWVHPASGRATIDDLAGMYAWHGDHHVAHITSLRARMGW